LMYEKIDNDDLGVIYKFIDHGVVESWRREHNINKNLHMTNVLH